MIKAICLSAVFALTAVTGNSAYAADAPKSPSCFSARDFENWKAPDAKTILIRVNTNRYYRLDLAGKCPGLLSPGAFLVTKFHGSDWICSPLDWDLKVAEQGTGISSGCIVKSMTELSPAEVSAIPPKFK